MNDAENVSAIGSIRHRSYWWIDTNTMLTLVFINFLFRIGECD